VRIIGTAKLDEFARRHATARRLIALVDFKKQPVQITGVMTHADYDKEKWK
jgi:hypothetical protein